MGRHEACAAGPGTATAFRPRGRWLGPLARFAGWWAGLFGFIAAGGGSVCPCCGSTACPVAPATAGVLSALLAALLLLPRTIHRAWGRCRRRS